MITTTTILSNVVHGVPSGNYDGSSMDWYSPAVEAADYYHGRSSLQTVTIDVTDFVGTIVIEATLDSIAETATWFTTETYSSGTPLTDRHPFAITGNFTWLRLHVTDFDAGTINFVRVEY